jgi:hypothetical protein
MQAPKIYKFLCLLFLLSLVSFISFSSAHASDYWIKTFGTDSWEGVSSNDSILPTSDGNYILTGSTEGDIFVTKIDPSGNIISNIKFDNNGKNDESEGIIQTSDNGYLVIGRSEDTDGNQTFIIFKLNSSFQVEWAKEIGEGIQEVKGIIEEDDKYVVGGVICQSQTDCDGFIASLNKSNGSLTNMKTYGSSGSSDVLEGFLYLTKAPDGNYISAGVTNVVLDQNGELQYADIWVMKINSSDYSIAWQYQYGPGFAEVVKTSTDGIVVSGSIGGTNDFLIMKLDSSGAVLWAETYGGTQYDELMDLVIDANGNIVAVGGSGSLSQDQKDGVILKVSGTGGGIIWQRYFNSGNPGDSASSIALSDTGYIVAGEYGINYQDVIVLRIDSDGNIDSTCASIYQTATFYESSQSLTRTQTQATSSDASINPNDISLTTSPISFSETQQCPSVNYTLTVSVTNPDYGNVWSSPSGINCGQGNSDCSEPYSPGTQVTLNANADYGFSGWGGDCSSCGQSFTCTITMDAVKTCTAVFEVPPMYNLNITKIGTGSGTVYSQDGRINCGNDCTDQYPQGSWVVLTVQPDAGSVLSSWGGDCSYCGTNTSCSIWINSDTNCTAQFDTSTQTYNLTVTKAGTGSGTVTFNPSGQSCGQDCQTYPVNQQVTLTAQPDQGSFFSNWGDDCSSCGTNSACQVLMNMDKGCVAVFMTQSQYWIKTLGDMYSSDSAEAMITLNDGSIVIAGESNGDILVMKLDNSGTVIWQKTYDNNGNYDYPDSIFKVSDGYLITGGSDSGNGQSLMILKIGEDGSISGSKEIQGEGILRPISEETEGYLIGGAIFNGNDFDGVVFNVSKDLSTINWQGKYATTDSKNEGFVSVTKLADGYIGTGAYDIQFDPNTGDITSAKIWVVKTDTLGNLLWQKDLGYGMGKRVFQTSDGGFIVGALGVFNDEDILLIKLDSNGDISWAKSYDSGGSDELMDMVMDGDGNVIVVGRSGTDNSSNGIILKVDGSGNIIWTKYYDSGSGGDEATAIALSGTDYIVAGRYGQNYGDIFLAKIDSDGNINDPSCGIYGDANLSQTDRTITPQDTSAQQDTVSITLSDVTSTTSDSSLSETQQCPSVNYTLTVSVTNPDYGNVWSSPSGINCGQGNSDCSEPYFPYTEVTLSASPNFGYGVQWGGDCAGCVMNNSCTITMDSAKTCTAEFIAVHQVFVMATGNGFGSIISDPAGISFNYQENNTGSANFTDGSTVILTATASTGSTVSWSGTCVSSGGTESGNNTPEATCTFTNLAEDKNVTATFNLNQNQYTITTLANPPEGGNITCTPNPVQHGSSSTCMITPNTGYHIDSVGGTCGGTLNGNIYTTDPITSNCTVTVNFALNTYTLTVSKYGTGYGTVTSDLAGISCGSDCTEDYTYGTVVTLTATPDEGSTFTGWSGACSGTGTCTVTIDSAKSVTATFTLNQYTLTVTKSGTGSGTVNATGCTLSWNGNTGTCTADHGTSITLSGTANTGSVFTGWSNGTGSASSCTGTENCTFTITEDSSVTATFTLKTYTVTPVAGSGGTITPDTPQTVTHGSTINITATASTGYHVAGIIGCGINYTNTSNDVTTYTTTTAPIISDCTVTATFDINHYTITTTVTPAGSGTVTCSPNPVNYGSSSTCTITPTTGYHIDSVSGTCGGTLSGNTYTTNPITSDCTVVANFTLNQYQVTANAKGNGSGSIISNPAGINFNYPATNSGSANFDHGTNVVLTATASTGSTVSWTNCSGTVTGNGTTQATCTFSNLDGAKTAEATFTLNTYTLTVTKSGTGSGTVNATGCTLSWNGNTGTCTADHGTSITLSGTANTGSTFTGWSNGTGSASSCTGTENCTFTITEDSSVTATFTAITAVKLLSPNGGEVIPSGSSYTIQWQAPANADHYTLKLSMDNGMTWSTIASNITGNSYDWDVPIPWNNKRKCFIKVIAFNASNVKIGADRSDGPFTIEVIKLNTPNGGETLTSGSTYNITWATNSTKKPVSKVILSYTLDGGVTWKAITTYTGGNNPGTHPWTVPTVSTSKTKCKVKVVLKDSAGNTIGSDVSDAFFTISPQ